MEIPTSQFIEFSKPFINAAKNIFETMVFTKLDPQRPSIKSNNVSHGDFSAVLGLSGKVINEGEERPYRAMLVLSWPTETYLKIAGAMLMEEYTEYSDDIADVGGEICNMIMGNAKRDLSALGYSTNMAIPSMIQGKNHTLNYPKGTIIVSIPIDSAHGNMFMEICFTID